MTLVGDAEPSQPGAPESVFNTGAASEIVGVSADRLQSWHLKGLLAPSIAGPDVRPPRRGIHGRRPGSIGRRYSVDDLMLALVIRELLASGVSVKGVREAVGAIKRTFGDLALHQALLRSRSRLVVVTNGEGRILPDDSARAGGGNRPRAVVVLSRLAGALQDVLADRDRRQRARARLPGERWGRHGILHWATTSPTDVGAAPDARLPERDHEHA